MSFQVSEDVILRKEEQREGVGIVFGRSSGWFCRSPLLIQVPAFASWDAADDGPSVWVPTIHTGTWDVIWLSPHCRPLGSEPEVGASLCFSLSCT